MIQDLKEWKGADRIWKKYRCSPCYEPDYMGARIILHLKMKYIKLGPEEFKEKLREFEESLLENAG